MIFFDLDETLFANRAAQEKAALEFYFRFPQLQNKYREAEFPQVWNEVTEKHVEAYLKKKASFQQQRRNRLKDIFQRDFQNHQADFLFERYLFFYKANWGLFPDVRPCLEQLHDHRLGILSNGDPEQQREKLRKLNIIDRFEIIVISGDIGTAKPDSEIFRYGCQMAGVDPENCFHVGDRLDTDGEAAAKAGLNGIWLNRNRKREYLSGVLTISTLLELPEMLTTGRSGG